MKIKVNEAKLEVLDWMVVMAHGEQHNRDFRFVGKRIYATQWAQDEGVIYSPSTTWAQGGLTIERAKITLIYWRDEQMWEASCPVNGSAVSAHMKDAAPLVAAMRCYVASKLGDEVDVPEELQ